MSYFLKIWMKQQSILKFADPVPNQSVMGLVPGLIDSFFSWENSIHATTTPWNWVSHWKSCHPMAWISTWNPTSRSCSGMDPTNPSFFLSLHIVFANVILCTLLNCWFQALSILCLNVDRPAGCLAWLTLWIYTDICTNYFRWRLHVFFFIPNFWRVHDDLISTRKTTRLFHEHLQSGHQVHSVLASIFLKSVIRKSRHMISFRFVFFPCNNFICHLPNMRQQLIEASSSVRWTSYATVP